MSSRITPIKNEQPSQGVGFLIAKYGAPPLSAAAAIPLVFRDLSGCSDQQRGLPISKMTRWEGIRRGLRVSPTIGLTIGVQMVLQSAIEKRIVGESKKTSLSSALASSAIVGTVSSPCLAVISGQRMGWSPIKTLRKFSPKQALAIAVQETCFVGGLSLADQLAQPMKRKLGDHRSVEYLAAFLSGVSAGLVSQPANTIVTRLQSDMTIDNPRQLMWGSFRRMRGVAFFSVLYKAGKEIFSSKVGNSEI